MIYATRLLHCKSDCWCYPLLKSYTPILKWSLDDYNSELKFFFIKFFYYII